MAAPLEHSNAMEQSCETLGPQARNWVSVRAQAALPTSCDVLVLGGGLAGLRASVRARLDGASVILVHEGRGASPFIIGCNAPFAHADPADTPEQYARDVVAAGCELSDAPLVDVLTRGTTHGVRELCAIGVPVARDGERFLQRHLSGNWYPRSVYDPDGLGAQALPALSAHAGRIGVQTLRGHRVVRLLKEGPRVCGALVFEPRSDGWKAIFARAVVMALGGLGRLYEESTYPGDVQGASYALGLEAGATLVDMEFVQFEPLCTFTPERLKGLELPTSLLAEGAVLLNSLGERFMLRHNPHWGEARIEKAKLSLCMQQEIDEGRGVEGGVIFDATQAPTEKIEKYVRHCKRLRSAGVDPLSLRIPIRPAAHSLMGGLWIDEEARTTVAGLYAAGEASGGLHGASRIAGNGGADALVFGALAGASAAACKAPVLSHAHQSVEQAFAAIASIGNEPGGQDVSEWYGEVRAALTRGAGLHRDADGLVQALATVRSARSLMCERAAVRLDAQRIDAFAAVGASEVAEAVLSAALMRKESRGAHQRTDYRETEKEWHCHVAVARDSAGGLHLDTRPIRT